MRWPKSERVFVMKRHTKAFAVAALSVAASTTAFAAKLPAIKVSEQNLVPACATPGRLGDYLKSRNGALDNRYDGIATEYMRHGEHYGIRWDYAFFQMLVETASLAYKRGNGKWGDVKPHQNNFAGLGATGGGEPGESFKDISTGVRAHIEHIVMYSGTRVENPTADRTRKVQEWNVLTSWQKSIKGPMSFSDLTRKWSPGDGSYAASIESVAQKFFDEFCSRPDPKPELVAEARKGRTGGEAKVAAAQEKPERISGADLARRAVEDAKAENNNKRTALGAGSLARAAESAQSTAAQEPNKTPAAPAVTILNAPKGETAQAPAVVQPAVQAPAKEAAVVKGGAAKDKPAAVQMASAAQAGRAAAAPPAQKAPAVAVPAPSNAKCNVYTASYGGQKAIIIKAATAEAVNYTVLDVNEGAEKRETDAYISAYAKGGQAIAEFGNQAQALDKAFELCPEG